MRSVALLLGAEVVCVLLISTSLGVFRSFAFRFHRPTKIAMHSRPLCFGHGHGDTIYVESPDAGFLAYKKTAPVVIRMLKGSGIMTKGFRRQSSTTPSPPVTSEYG
ncbi:hypothetical protein B0H63DRAFT_38993 [Podospora didyma]|uniref:Uncharacterized protein n=1 Tax=Podospora didyma TaxID=330526 RepID=A0AAE0P6G1_9PEZI|nr:hypothetical protein B0H63DRAFT_38993 [Podospora didyma]